MTLAITLQAAAATAATWTTDPAHAADTKYRALFDSIDEGFCVIEVLFDAQERPVDYRFIEVNPSFERQTGLSDAVGRRMRELAPAHEEHWFRIYGEVALGGQSVRFENRAEALHRWYDVYAFRVGDPAQIKLMGYSHIPQRHASAINAFYSQLFNPYLNFHRPCYFAVDRVDAKGKVRKTYPHDQIMTPWERLQTLSDYPNHLKPGITVQTLEHQAGSMSDNDAALRVQKARKRLFQSINRRSKLAA